MSIISYPLVVWENGIWMIGVFALVVLILIAAVLGLLFGGKKHG